MIIFSKKLLSTLEKPIEYFSGTANALCSLEYYRNGVKKKSVLASADGKNWKIVRFFEDDSYTYTTIKRIQNSDYWVAVIRMYEGSTLVNGKMCISQNGKDWSEITFIDGVNWNDARNATFFYANNIYYVRYNSKMYKITNFQSYEQVTFTYNSTPSTATVGTPIYGGNNTFFMTQGRQFYKSTNGTSWTLIDTNNRYNISNCATDLSGFAVGYSYGNYQFSSSYIYNYGSSKSYANTIQISNCYPSVSQNFILVYGKIYGESSLKKFKIVKNSPNNYTEITTTPTYLDSYSKILDMYFAKDVDGSIYDMYYSTDAENYTLIDFSSALPSGCTKISCSSIYTY